MSKELWAKPTEYSNDDSQEDRKPSSTTASVKKVGVLARSGCSGAAGTHRNTYFFYR